MRRGFGLVEVIVAMTLLGVGLLAIGAGAAFASRVVGIAETQENAARLAATVLDSIAVLPQWTDGTAESGRLHAEWRGGAAGGEARVVITVPVEPGIIHTYGTTTPPLLATVPAAYTGVGP